MFDWGNTLMKVLAYPGPMALWPKVMAMPGAERVLGLLAPEYHLALATNAKDSGTEQVRQALDRVGLGTYLDRIYCSNELGVPKKDPGFYLKVLELAGIGPSKAVMVGDNLEEDVLVPSRAG